MALRSGWRRSPKGIICYLNFFSKEKEKEKEFLLT
jgi:hypothetical protein